jgi:hypothetical protein
MANLFLSTIYKLRLYLQKSDHSFTDIWDVLNRHLKLVAKGSMF